MIGILSLVMCHVVITIPFAGIAEQFDGLRCCWQSSPSQLLAAHRWKNGRLWHLLPWLDQPSPLAAWESQEL